MGKLTLRELVILATIARYNKQQVEAARKRGIPSESIPSAVSPCTVSTLWNRYDQEDSIVNAFIRNNGLNENPVMYSEQIYRSVDKLEEAGLLFPRDNDAKFILTKQGLDIAQYLDKMNPKDWPDQVDYESGRTHLKIH